MINFTEQDYRGWIIEWAHTRASQEGKWMGHFRVRKDAEGTYHGISVANMQDSPAEADAIAKRLAMQHVDALEASR